MNDNQNPVDPLPEEFDSYEEVVAFWDTHDTTDYLEAFETVEVEDVDIKHHRFEIEVKADLMVVLSKQAEERGIAISQLVDSLLREGISTAV